MSASDSVHPFKIFLQLQLASDKDAVLSLPYLIQFLSSQHLQPSPHLQKWVTRINSLIHSKDPGARWAGLSLACQTSILSRELMLENARSWVSVALPLFSKQEPVPTLKAAVRLLTHVFSVAIDTPEFQRQVASPNIPKFGLALIVVAEDHPSRELKLLAIDALFVLVPLYPTIFKALHGRLSALCLRQFNGSVGRPMDGPLAQATSRLYSVLPATGGKVGAATLWRKSVDEILSMGWASLYALRTTFPSDANANVAPKQYQPYMEDATLSIPLNLDRLRCAVLALCDLLTSTTARAIQLPLGALVGFSRALLSCTRDNDKEDGRAEPSVRAMEEAAVSEICALGNDLLSRLATCTGRHLTPHAGRFARVILFHLELAPPPNQYVAFLRALVSLLLNVHMMDFPLVLNRIAKVLLSTLSVLLPTQSDIRTGAVSVTSSKGRKSRKRAHDYEGDEIFKTTTNVICPTSEHNAMILTSLDALRLLLRNPCLPPATYSLISRVVLNLNVWLPSLDPTRLSGDLSLHTQILRGFQCASIDLSADTRSAMGSSLGLIMHELLEPIDDPGAPSTSILRDLDRLLHPRVPPLVRAPSHIELLSLSRAEESVEEQEIREGLHIDVIPSSSAIETTCAENQQSIPAPASSSLPLFRTSDTLLNIDEPKVPGPAPLQVSSPHPQGAASPNLEPASTPSNVHDTASPARSPGHGYSDSNDTLQPSQAREAPPSLMCGVVTASEESRLGAVPDIIDAVDDDDEDDDDEMPSIDMGSDSE